MLPPHSQLPLDLLVRQNERLDRCEDEVLVHLFDPLRHLAFDYRVRHVKGGAELLGLGPCDST